MKWWWTSLLWVSVLTLGCSSGSSKKTSDLGGIDVPLPPGDVIEPPAGPPARNPRRLSIEQLNRSLPIVTDGLSWTEDFGEGEVNLFEILASTLGVPDYLLVTEENLEPSLIVTKFLQDAAQRICVRWVERDKALPLEQRTLVTHTEWQSVSETDVKASLRTLHLRFFARYIPPGQEDAKVQAHYNLFQAASGAAPAAAAASDGWTAICLALMNEPEFMMY